MKISQVAIDCNCTSTPYLGMFVILGSPCYYYSGIVWGKRTHNGDFSSRQERNMSFKLEIQL